MSEQIEQLRQIAKVNGDLYRSAENDVTAVIAELAAIDAEMDEFAQRHNPECECEVIHSAREVVRRIRAVLTAPHSPAGAGTPIPTPTEAHDG